VPAKRTPSKAKRKPKRTPAKRKTKAKAQERKPTLNQYLTRFRGDVEKVNKDIATIHTLSDTDCVAHVRRWLSTGCLELDRALTPPALHENGLVGGIPCGRVVEIFGPAHIGKSTTLDHIFATVQRMDGAAILLETDSGRDEHYTGRIGVDTSKLQYFQFAEDKASIENVGQEALESIRWWRKNAPTVPVVIGFDALGVTPTQAEIQKKVGEDTTASAAKVMRKLCRRIASELAGTNIVLVILNHEYKAISFGGGVTPSKTYGGEALPLLSAVRVKLHPVRDGWLKQTDGTIIGRKTGFEIVKFKLGAANRAGTFGILHGYGVDNTWTLWDTLGRAGIIQINGSWGAVNINSNVHRFQGWHGLRRLCWENPELFAQLVDVYRQHVRQTDNV